MHRMEHKEYSKQNSEKEKGKKQVQEKYNRKTEVDRVDMLVIIALNDSLLDDDDFEQHVDVSMIVIKDDAQVYDLLFAMMANSDEDEDDKVTLLDIKKVSKTILLLI